MAICASTVKNKDETPYFEVIGLDLPTEVGEHRVASINEGLFPFNTVDENLKIGAASGKLNGNLWATTDPKKLELADIIIVDVQLDVMIFEDGNVDADLVPLGNAIETIALYIKKGALVIVETTVPPGCCEGFVREILAQGCAERGTNIKDIMLAHSFERVMPGKNYLHSISNYWRVFAGYNDKSSKACRNFLSRIIDTKKFPLKELSSMTASETAKIVENSFRAVNIAFIEEWSEFAEKVGLDMYEIVEAIRVRPSHQNIMQPGLGVGGYCLTKDPYLGKVGINKFFNRGSSSFPFSDMAIEVNKYMPVRNSRRIIEFLSPIEGHKILFMGAAYKPDVDDTRNSPSLDLVRELLKRDIHVVLHDPLVKSISDLSCNVIAELPVLSDFSALIIAVPHEVYQNLDIISWIDGQNIKIFDCCNLLNQNVKVKLRALGCEVAATGVGNFI